KAGLVRVNSWIFRPMSFSNDGSISNDGPISVDPFGLTARITHPQRYTNHFQHFATLKTRMFVCYLLCCGRLLFVWYLFVVSICGHLVHIKCTLLEIVRSKEPDKRVVCLVVLHRSWRFAQALAWTPAL